MEEERKQVEEECRKVRVVRIDRKKGRGDWLYMRSEVDIE